MLPNETTTTAPLGLPRERDGASARLMEPGRMAQMAARLRSGSLDRALGAGADPSESRVLAARASALTSPGCRGLIADGLERLISGVDGPQRRWWALANRSSVSANRLQLRELAALLRGPTPLYAHGIAILSELLSDGCGPAYSGSPEALARLLSDARAAMGGP